MLSNCLTTLHQQCLFAAGDPRTCHPSVSKAHTRYTMKSSMITRGRSALCSGPVPAQQGARRRLTVVATSTADPAVRFKPVATIVRPPTTTQSSSRSCACNRSGLNLGCCLNSAMTSLCSVPLRHPRTGHGGAHNRAQAPVTRGGHTRDRQEGIQV